MGVVLMVMAMKMMKPDHGIGLEAHIPSVRPPVNSYTALQLMQPSDHYDI